MSQSYDAFRTYTIVGQNDSDVGWLSVESRRNILIGADLPALSNGEKR
jgi:hypothetical protein